MLVVYFDFVCFCSLLGLCYGFIVKTLGEFGSRASISISPPVIYMLKSCILPIKY